MNFRFSNIPRARWLFLGAVVVAVFVIGWIITEPLRTGIWTHRLGTYRYFNVLFIERNYFPFSKDELVWRYSGPGAGVVFSSPGSMEWELAHTGRREINDVTSEDVRQAAYASSPFLGVGFYPALRFRADDESSTHIIRDGHILLVRRSNARQTVYALQAVEQKDGRSYFRSRRILPERGGSGTGSNAAPYSGASR